MGLATMVAINRVWNRMGIQRQLTALAMAVVALSLGLGIFLLANLLTRSLSNSLAEQTIAQARHVAVYVAEHGSGALPGDLDIGAEYRVQVITATGSVVWASPGAGRQPMSALRPAPGTASTEGAEQWWGGGDDDERPLIAAYGLHAGQHQLVVLVATDQDEQHQAVSAMAALLLAAVPLFMLVAATMTWWLVRRALSAVDAMTGKVARINSPIGDQRLPLPLADDELRRLGVTMNQMLDRLQTVQRNQRSFISDASHELRSPVASLSGAIEIASAADDLKTWRELAPLMASEVHRLEMLVQGLLSLSRADDSGLTLTCVEVDVDDLATDEVARLRSITDKQVRAKIGPARVVADASLVRQLLVNLGDNAVRHAHDLVQVTVLQTADGGVMVQVDDDGAGVPLDQRERIFERFVRLEESRNRDAGGSGLGLAIVAQIVRAHHGHVEVLDSQLGGAAFVVHLPPWDAGRAQPPSALG